MQEVDDWMWYEDHAVFKKQACMQSAWVNKSSSQVKEWPKYNRILSLFMLTANALYVMANPQIFPKEVFEQCLYLSTVGYFTIFLTFVAGSYVSFSKNYNGLQMG